MPKRIIHCAQKNIRKTIKLLKLSTFDAWKYENEELIHHIIAMFQDLHILDELGITVFRLHAWLVRETGVF